jgi:hypothetical protein
MVCLVLLKAADILKLKSDWFKKLLHQSREGSEDRRYKSNKDSKLTIGRMNGFRKVADNYAALPA